MNVTVPGLLRACVVTTTLVGVASCGGGGYGGGGGGNPPGSTTYTLGGTVTGLAGTGLRIQNGTAKLAITGNAAFTFPDRFANGTAFNITVDVQPTSPTQDCKVANGTGTVGAANVTNVAITCTTVATGLTLNNSTPASGANGVPRTVEPALTFSSALNAATVTPSAVSLRSASGEQAITPTVAANVLTVKSTRTLLPMTPYTLTVNTALRDTAGLPLADPITVSFTTADGVWQASKPIQKDLAADSFAPKIAFSANGDAIAVWEQSDGNRTFVWANRYLAGQGWQEAQQIDDQPSSDPQVALDANGKPFVVWRGHVNPTDTEVWTRPAPDETGEWGEFERLDDPGAHEIEGLQLSMGANGDAFIVWREATAAGADVDARLNRFVAGEWQGPEFLESSDEHAFSPSIAADANGGAVAVWAQKEAGGTHQRILASRYVAGGPWTAPVPIDDETQSDADRPHVAIDANGNVLAVWDQRTSANADQFRVWANRTVGTAWDTPSPIEGNDDLNPRGARLAMNARGEAVVAFYQGPSEALAHVSSNYYTPADGWRGAKHVDTEGPIILGSLNVAIDASGNALLVLPQLKDTVTHARPYRYIPSENAWRAATALNSDADFQMWVAIDANGSAMAVWSEFTGQHFNIQAGRFE